MSKQIKTMKKPVLPIYMAALVWVLCAVLPVPLHKPLGIGIAAVLSAAVFAVGKKLCPQRVEIQEVDFMTGSEDTDAMLSGITEQLNRLHGLNEAIPDEQLSTAMTRMERAGRSIVSKGEAKPDQAKLIRRFADYYLPDAVRILDTYAQLEKQGVKGENADQLRSEIRANAATIASAFEKQLDSLYADANLDIGADLDVLKTILKSQGLA